MTVRYPKGSSLHTKLYLTAQAFSGCDLFIHFGRSSTVSALKGYLESLECTLSGIGEHRQSFVSLQSLSHTDHVIQFVAEASVKFYRFFVLCPDLDVDLWAADISQQSFGMLHERPAITKMPHLRSDSQIVNPSPVPVVSGHDRANELTVNDPDEKHMRLDLQFSTDIFYWVIPRSGQAALLPQRDNAWLISFEERSYMHHLSAALMYVHFIFGTRLI